MADRPFDAPLPADLPEDWTSGQIVAPAGADVGLSQHNCLMEQVNAAQRAANAINESFDTISGKRTCRFVIGTSTAGWTQADCDYLCDGTDDQVKIKAAIDAAPPGGCEIVLLDGEYNLTEERYIDVSSKNISIVGNLESTVLKIESFLRVNATLSAGYFSICRVTFTSTSPETTAVFQAFGASAAVQRCRFQNVRAYISTGVDRGENMSILFNENTMELSSGANLGNGGFTMLHVDLLGLTAPAFFQVSGNILRYAHDLPASSYVLNVDSSKDAHGFVINNIVLCTGAGGMCQVRRTSCLMGNRFSGVSVTADVVGIVSGNSMEGGTLGLVSFSSLSEEIRERMVVVGNSVKMERSPPKGPWKFPGISFRTEQRARL